MHSRAWVLASETPFPMHFQFFRLKVRPKSAFLQTMYLAASESEFDHANRNLCLKASMLVYKRVMSQSSVDILLELHSPFLKGGNSAFIAAIVSGLFPKSEYQSFE